MKNIIYLCILSLTLISHGQENTSLDYYFSQQNISTLDKDIPTPESVIGHSVGKWHISHDKLVEYMRKLASSSERITIEERGKTFEDRPLILLTITSKKNHQNINQIQKNHINQTNGIITPKTDSPLVVYQGFSIHGNEPSGSNSALLLAYYLAASNDDFVNKLLNNTIILLDPSFNPDGYFISNGPGDPEPLVDAQKLASEIIEKDLPLFGICLGHQVIALSQGISTYKMHNGHRGINHPIKNLLTGKGEITSQNHGFAINREETETNENIEITHVHLNDHTVAGIRIKNKNTFSVQYHPEASPGPHDAEYLFDQFIDTIKKMKEFVS